MREGEIVLGLFEKISLVSSNNPKTTQNEKCIKFFHSIITYCDNDMHSSYVRSCRS